VPLGDMMTELRGAVPKLPMAFTKTLINRAWRTVRESDLWSFNLYESAWISPPTINTGTVTVTQGSASIQFDAAATAAINAGQIAQPYSLITQRQFRPGNVAGVAGIYNLLSYNQITGAAVLDRIYADPAGAGLAYNLYQLYYPAPFVDHLSWISVRNMQMFLDLDLDTERQTIDAWDPQRSWYQFPTRVVPYMIDNRGQGTQTPSATLGFPLFELWGQPVTPYTYSLYGIRRGVDLVNPSDSLPLQVGEDLIIALAKYYAYEWAESNKDMSPRSAGPDFKFLMGATLKDAKDLKVRYRKQDKEFVNAWFSIRNPQWYSRASSYYNTIASVAGPYGGF
jgi:hypothetical protein